MKTKVANGKVAHSLSPSTKPPAPRRIKAVRAAKPKLVKLRLGNGKIIRLPELSEKPVDPLLKMQADQHAQSIIEGFANAVREAKEKGVPLWKIVPVN